MKGILNAAENLEKRLQEEQKNIEQILETELKNTKKLTSQRLRERENILEKGIKSSNQKMQEMIENQNKNLKKILILSLMPAGAIIILLMVAVTLYTSSQFQKIQSQQETLNQLKNITQGVTLISCQEGNQKKICAKIEENSLEKLRKVKKQTYIILSTEA